MTLLHKLILASVIAATIQPASAQEKVITSVRFVTFPVYTPTEPIELIVGDGSLVPIELPTNSLSPVYRMENIQKCILGKKVVDKEGKPSFEIYGQTPKLSSTDQIILVTSKGAKPSDGFEMIPFDGSEDGFGGGKYLLLNASEADIAGNIGTSKFSIKPNQHKLIAPTPSKEETDGRKYLYTTVYFRTGDIIRPFYSSTWRLSDKAKCMVFFHHDPNTKQLRTHTIRHYIE